MDAEYDSRRDEARKLRTKCTIGLPLRWIPRWTLCLVLAWCMSIETLFYLKKSMSEKSVFMIIMVQQRNSITDLIFICLYVYIHIYVRVCICIYTYIICIRDIFIINIGNYFYHDETWLYTNITTFPFLPSIILRRRVQ